MSRQLHHRIGSVGLGKGSRYPIDKDPASAPRDEERKSDQARVSESIDGDVCVTNWSRISHGGWSVGLCDVEGNGWIEESVGPRGFSQEGTFGLFY